MKLLIFIDQLERRYNGILEFREEATSPSKTFGRSSPGRCSVETEMTRTVLKKKE
jgi:hypothetical protein